MMDSALVWILGSSVLMSAIALVGSITLIMPRGVLERWLLTLVAFSAGSLLGGAFFHMLPAALASSLSDLGVYIFLLAGFATFLGLEQFLHWHHCHRASADCKQPLTYLILIGDGLHNFLGGLAVAGAFLIDIRLGIVTWLAAAAHEVPQELGDFGVLVHGGWGRRQALLLNVLSALTFLVGGIIAYLASFRLDVAFLVAFAVGNFIYIGASDLVPEIKAHDDAKTSAAHFTAFAAGIALMLLMRLVLEP